MKSVLHYVLIAALLLQGALAIAMPISIPAPAAESSMPCHGGEQANKAMPCCAHDHCACQAICSAIALPVAITSRALPSPTLEPIAREPLLARAAFRLTPLRPPIALSA